MGRAATFVQRVALRTLAGEASLVLHGIEHRPAPRIRSTDRQLFNIDEHVELHVMWIDRPDKGEDGPMWSAFGDRHELMWVDMFPGSTHLHPAIGILNAMNVARHRWLLAGDTLAEVAALGFDECRRHLGFQVECHLRRRLRRSAPTATQQLAATQWHDTEVTDPVARHAKW